MSFSLKRFNSQGFHVHLILPVLAIIAVGGIGTYLLDASHAATVPTLSSSCRGYQFSANGSNVPANSKSPVAKDCVVYIQDITNGVYIAAGDKGNSKYTYTVYAPAVNSWARAQNLAGGVIKNDGQFGPATASRVMAFQASFQYDNTTADSLTDLSADGVVGPNTWEALCGMARRLPAVDIDYKAANHAWVRSAYAAASRSGCGIVGVNNGLGVHVHSNPTAIASGSGSSGGTVTSGGGSGSGPTVSRTANGCTTAYPYVQGSACVARCSSGYVLVNGYCTKASGRTCYARFRCTTVLSDILQFSRR